MADVRVRDMATASTPLQPTDLLYIVQGTQSGDRQVAYANLTNPSGAVAGSYGAPNNVPQLTVNTQGFVTAISNRSLANADLPNSGVSAATYGDSTHVAQVAVNAKGVITSASNVSIGGGTVTSVGLSMPAQFSVSGSPVTSSGTLTVTLINESANTVFAGPTTGAAAAPTFRSLVNADLPTSGVTAATYGDSSHVAQVVVNAQGVVTSASNIAISGGGVGTVTSVGLSMPAEFSVANSPVTSSGTLTVTWANESANKIFAGPTSGGAATPAFRSMVNADLPTSGASAGSYGSSTQVAAITVNAQGVITSVSNVGISGGSAGSGLEAYFLME